MKKTLIFLISLGFTLCQESVTTKEIIIQINENTTSIDISDYINLESGYYSVELVHANLLNTDCDNWWLWIWGLNSYVAITSTENDPYEYWIVDDGRHLTITNENSLFLGEELGNLINSNNDTQIDLEIIFHISGKFQSDYDTGDMNEDGNVDILDVIVLVNAILDNDLGNVSDVIELTKKV